MPIVLLSPDLILLTNKLETYSNYLVILRTLSLATGLRSGLLFGARETVLIDTPAFSAITSWVTLGIYPSTEVVINDTGTDIIILYQTISDCQLLFGSLLRNN